MKKLNKKPLATAVGAAVVTTFTSGAANAEANPFSMTELSEGYMQLAQSDTASEMKCGANMSKKVEGSCGEGKCGEAKCGEGKCAGNLAKTGGNDTANSNKGYTVKKFNGYKVKKANSSQKTKEASCGEGKCGAMMEEGKMKKGMESSCGAMMKGKEGACGMGGMGSMSGGMGNMKMDGDMKGMKDGEMSCGAMMEKMKSGEMSCGAMMKKMKGMKGMMGGGMMGGGMNKGGEMSCGSKIDPEKAAGK